MQLRRTSYLFVSGSITREGGIGSIVAMVSRYLAEQHMACACLVFGDIPSTKLHPNVVAIDLGRTGFWTTCKQIARSMPDGEDIIIVSFDPTTSAYAVLISSYLRMVKATGSVKHLINVLHPREFFPHFENMRTHRMNRMLASMIGPESFIYMNEPVQRSHEKFFKWKPISPATLTVPMDARPPRWTPQARPDRLLRVCSVGRIVAFKAYNFEAVGVSKELANLGLEISWDIFGYGDEEAKLRTMLKKQGKSRVSLKGELPIRQFDATVSKYDVFVGMGLSALQAAQLGVPTILAVDSAGSESYGWLDRVPHGIVGDNIAGIQKQQISEVLIKFSEMSVLKRREISARQVLAAKRYSVDAYIKGLKSIAPIGLDQRTLLSKLASLAFLLVNSKIFRRIVRALMLKKLWATK